MSITKKAIKLLWSSAAGRCSFEGCAVKLSIADAAEFAPHTIGEMAHINGAQPGSNRHDAAQTAIERDSYDNLILLCPNHHTMVDRPENEERYSADILRKMKAAHAADIDRRLTEQVVESKQQACKKIASLLADNHAAWKHFGPFSEIAQKNPHNDSAYVAWRSERLTTIVPNNRSIAAVLEQSRHLFDAPDQAAISAFLLHQRSYEQWVQDEIEYKAVLGFPKEFEAMIHEGANAGT